MVSLKDVQLSNSRIASALPAHLVAVYVGATSGIGEASLKQFAKYARQPRIYFVGRSQESGDRISAELGALNPEGEYTFIKADVSLIRTVDKVCDDIKSKEKTINLLFLCQGTLLRKDTYEGLDLATSLAYYSRTRFIINLLPLLQQATDLRRVITVFAGTYEGPVDLNDISARNLSPLAVRGHSASIITSSLEMLAKKAPEVTFIHSFPGSVKTNLVRGGEGAAIFILSIIIKVIGPLVNISSEECGERYAFLATSARFPAGLDGDATAGVPLAGGVALARGTDGKAGSGVYSLDSTAESASPKKVAFLASLRKEGVPEKVWKHTEDEFSRILGTKS